MNYLILAVGSIIYFLCYWSNRKKWFRFQICPICASVAGIWIGLLAVKYFLQLPINELLTSLLLGGSAVGISYRMDIYIQLADALKWRTMSVLTGFVIGYSLLAGNWWLVLIGLVAYGLIINQFVFQKKLTNIDSQTGKLERDLKNCC